jgi:MFS family permease
MWMLIVATAISGIGGALCYRGSLQVVNKIAPEDRRAEVTSSYFLVSFLGNSLPIIGVALLGALIGPIGAYEIFGAIVALIAIAALLLTLFSREYRAS